MAEISSNNSGRKGRSHKIRATKHSTKIDMTPMVDLAFLLLTFFILTSTLTQFNVMEVGMRDEVEDTDDQERINENNIMHVVLAENNKVAWWIGNEDPAYSDFSANGFRKLLIEKRQQNPKLFVLIKPMESSVYQNMVDILDEMQIIQNERFTIVDFTDEDQQKLSSLPPPTK